MKAIDMKQGVYWVGGIDWDLRSFHGYLTQRGSTYNAYLIIDEKITLLDTVKHYLADELIERISHVVDPAKIDYVVSNHVEMDHSGSLPRIMELAPNATVYTSAPKGEFGLKAHYHPTWTMQPVKTGDTLNLGQRTLHFVQTPMVHWPDNMVAYCPEEKLLFSNDAFGQHLASSERFDDEYPLNIIMEEAKKYYANIVLPYSGQVQRAMQALGGLDIEMIAPSHGIIWRANIPALLTEYQKWSTNQTDKKALIIYDTMWHSTEKMAYAIESAFEDKGYKTRMLNLEANHISDIMTELIDAKYICVGSPTLNNSMLPAVGAFLTYLRGLAPKGRIGLAFGSYGWSGQSVKMVEELLASSGFEMLDSIKMQYIPDAEALNAITEQVKAALA